MEDKVQKQLEKLLDYEFTTPDFLIKAMVHRSFCAENPDAESNERMEFLGDSVLGLSVTTYIFDTYPDLSEGELSKLRASVVKADVLAEVANEIELGAALRLGKGEDASGGARNRQYWPTPSKHYWLRFILMVDGKPLIKSFCIFLVIVYTIVRLDLVDLILKLAWKNSQLSA